MQAPRPGVLRRWWRVAAALGAAVAGIAAFFGNLSKIEQFSAAIVDRVRVSFTTDTTVATMVGSLYTTPESERVARLLRLKTILDGRRALVPVGRERLAGFVKAKSQRQPGDRSCADSSAARTGVKEALDIVLTRRAPRRRWLVFGPAVELPMARLNFDGTNLRGIVYPSADLRHASLAHACLRGAQLSGAILDGADLRHARLDSAVLRGAHLRRAKLDFAEGGGVDLSNARLEGASANAARLPGASFVSARLACATFEGARLEGAQFLWARIPWAFFHAATLTGVRDWEQMEPTSVAGAFVRTAKLAPRLKAWAYQRGADSASARSPIDWSEAREAQWARDSVCERSARER